MKAGKKNIFALLFVCRLGIRDTEKAGLTKESQEESGRNGYQRL
jgi:hypothetical protein